MSAKSMQCAKCRVWHPIENPHNREDVVVMVDGVCDPCKGDTPEARRQQARAEMRQLAPEGTVAGGEPPKPEGTVIPAEEAAPEPKPKRKPAARKRKTSR